MWQGIDLAAHALAADLKGVRMVEDQNQSATLNLVDDYDEHDVLERMLEDSKPPKPEDCAVDDYLLFTPFRYPPLLEGTRFGKSTERSPFYGSKEIETAMCEVAHRRFQFMDDTEAELPSIAINYTSFTFHARAKAMLDLTTAPFADFYDKILHPTNYSESQKLATEARKNEIEALQFHSVRYEGGVNYCLFTPSLFTKKATKLKHWLCHSSYKQVSFHYERELIYAVER